MKRRIVSSISGLVGLIGFSSASALWYSSEVLFCPQTNTTAGHCEIHLNTADLYNFVGGPTSECFMTREGAPFGGIVSEKRFDDGNTNFPVGEVLLSEAHLFPSDSPIQNRKEYCVIFESATVYRFFWSENQNYVVKDFIIDSLALPQFSHCDEHQPGGGDEGDN